MSLLRRIRRFAWKLRGRDLDFTSVVFLLRERRPLSKERLQEAIEKAWHIKLPDSSDQYIVVVESPIIFVKAKERMLQVLNAAHPYLESPAEVAKTIKDNRVREAVLNHKAWLLVDYVAGSGSEEKHPDKRYSQCAKLAAELLDEDCTGVCLPGDQRIVAISPNTADQLKNFQSVKEFCLNSAPPPVVNLSDDFICKARTTAKERLSEFSTEFESSGPEDRFLLKKRFADGDSVEWMWVQVKTVEAGRFFGVLESDPLWLKTVRRGDAFRSTRTKLKIGFILKTDGPLADSACPWSPRI